MRLTKSTLRKFIKEELKLSEAETEMITLPGTTTGGGRMRVDQLEQQIRITMGTICRHRILSYWIYARLGR